MSDEIRMTLAVGSLGESELDEDDETQSVFVPEYFREASVSVCKFDDLEKYRIVLHKLLDSTIDRLAIMQGHKKI